MKKLLCIFITAFTVLHNSYAMKKSCSMDCISKQVININHIIVDFKNCYVSEEISELETVLRVAAKLTGSTDLEFIAHKFEPHGISAVLILAESHISIHYWPEERYATLDIMTCGKHDPKEALNYLKATFHAQAMVVHTVIRPLLAE